MEYLLDHTDGENEDPNGLVRTEKSIFSEEEERSKNEFGARLRYAR